MSKKSFIVSTVIKACLGIGMIFVRGNEFISGMGAALLAATVALFLKRLPIFLNAEKYKEYMIANKDERNVHLARKSQSYAFWITLMAQTVLLIVMGFLNRVNYANMIAYLICFELAVYLVTYYILKARD